MTFETIETARLQLRELYPTDKAALLEFVQQPEQLRWMSIDFPDQASVDSFLADAHDENPFAERKNFLLAACLAETGEFLGCVALEREGDKSYAAELGYFFLERHWGKGYAKEASQALLDFGFGPLGLHRIWGKCHVQNQASAGVMSGIGMLLEGTMREHFWQRDHYRSSHLFAMIKSDWEALRPKV